MGLLDWLVPHPRRYGLYCALHTIIKVTNSFNLGIADALIVRVNNDCKHALSQLNAAPCHGKNPLLGKGITKHPIVGVMWHNPPDRSIAQPWLMIQAVYLGAYLSEISDFFTQNTSISSSIIQRFYNRSTSIRALFDIKDAPKRARCINHLCSYIEYDSVDGGFSLRQDEIEFSGFTAEEAEILSHAFESIRLLLSHYRYGGGGIGKRKRIRLNARHTAHLVREEGTDTFSYTIQVEDDEETRADTLPFRLYSPSEMAGRLQKLRIQEHIRRKSQLFVPWALPYASLNSKGWLYQRIYDFQHHPQVLLSWSDEDVLQFIAGLLGWPVKQVAKLLISDDPAVEPAWPDQPIVLTQTDQGWEWKLALVTPNVQDNFTPARPRLRYLTLLDQWQLAMTLYSRYGYGRPFALKTFIQKLNLVDEQIRTYRFMLFHYGNKDRAIMGTLAGDPTMLSDARLFYAQYTEQALGTCLEKALTHRFGSHSPFKMIPVSPQAMGPARFTPYIEDLRQLVQNSIRLPVADPRCLVGRKALIAHYNAALWRTYLMLALSTGIRVGQALQAVWIFWRAFPNTAFVPISDKSPHVDVNARVVPLHGRLREYLRHFYFTQQHCKRALGLEQLEGFQFIDDDEQVHSIGKRWVAEQLELRGMRWPDNFHRACVRSILIFSQVPLDEVDFFMGHATLGDQPQSPLSTLSVQSYLVRCHQAIKTFIENQLKWPRPDLRPFQNACLEPAPQLARCFIPDTHGGQSSSKAPRSQFQTWLQKVDIAPKGSSGYRRAFSVLSEIAQDNAFATWLVAPNGKPPDHDEIEKLDMNLIARLVDAHVDERLNAKELRRALTLRYRLYHQAVGAPKSMLIPLFSPMRQSPFIFERCMWAAEYAHYRACLRRMLRKKQPDQDDLALLGLHAVLNGGILNKQAFAALVALTDPAVNLDKHIIKCGDLRYLGYNIPTQRGSVPKRAYLDDSTFCLLRHVRKKARDDGIRGYSLDATWKAMHRQLKRMVDPAYVYTVPRKRNAFISRAKHLYLCSLPHAVVASLTGTSQNRTFDNPRYFPLPISEVKLYQQDEGDDSASWSEEDLTELRNIVEASNNIEPWAQSLMPRNVSAQVEKYIERWVLPLFSLSVPNMPDTQDMVDLLDLAKRVIPQGKGYPQKKALQAVAGQYKTLTGEKLDWQPPGRIKQTDNSVITIDEYREALLRLDNDIQKASSEDRRQLLRARKLFLMLAFRTGMRRSEILALEKSDFDLSSPYGMLRIEHKPHNRLKTQHAVRSIPLKYLMPDDEWQTMQGIFATIPAERLFTYRNPDNQIVRPLIRLLREVSGNKAFVVHHLRHSFATWTYLKIRCARNSALAERFAFLPTTYAELRHANQLAGKLISSNTTQSDLFYIAMLMGHSSPMVSIANYLHGIDLY